MRLKRITSFVLVMLLVISSVQTAVFAAAQPIAQPILYINDTLIGKVTAGTTVDLSSYLGDSRVNNGLIPTDKNAQWTYNGEILSDGQLEIPSDSKNSTRFYVTLEFVEFQSNDETGGTDENNEADETEATPRMVLLRQSGAYGESIASLADCMPGTQIDLSEYYAEKAGYTAQWVYNAQPVTDDVFTVPEGRGTVMIYLVYTPIDYIVRIDAGEHGIYRGEGTAICETALNTRIGGGVTLWEGRYDIDGLSYGTDDLTGEPHSSKTYDNGKQSYSAVLGKPEADNEWFFTGWTITYYDDGFDALAADANGRKTELSNTSSHILGGSAGEGDLGGGISDTTQAMYGNCVITANYTNEAYVVAVPKGDSVNSGYTGVSNYNPETYSGYITELMGGSESACTKLSTLESVRAVTHKDTECDFGKYNYYAVPKGGSLSFWVYMGAGFSARVGYGSGNSRDLDGKDIFGNPSDRGGKYTDFNVSANGYKLMELGKGVNTGVSFSIGGYSNPDANIELCEKYSSAADDGVITIAVTDLEPNPIRVTVRDNTASGGFEVVWDTEDDDYLGELSRFQVTNTATGKGVWQRPLPAIRWGGTINFHIEDADGNVVTDGIRVTYNNRTVYSNMTTLTYDHYGKKQSAENGSWQVLYGDNDGTYTWKYMPNDMYAYSGTLQIEDFSIEQYKEEAVKELYNTAGFCYNIAGAGAYSDVLHDYANQFWAVVSKGNLKYLGKTVIAYPGKYQKYDADTQEYADWENVAEEYTGQSFAGWATNTAIWAAYYLESSLDAAGDAVREALFAIADADNVQDVRAAVSNDSGYVKRINGAKAIGAAAYDKYMDEIYAKQLETSYVNSLADNNYAVADISVAEPETLAVGVTYEAVIDTGDLITDKLSVSIPADDLISLADNQSPFTIKSGLGTIEFSTGAVQNIAASDALDLKSGQARSDKKVYFNITAQAAEDTPSLTQAQIDTVGAKKTVFDLTVTNERGKAIQLSGADVSVTVPYTLAEGENTNNIKVWYINNVGEAEFIGIEKCSYDDNNQLWVTFTTTHFSAYVVTKAVTTTIRHSGTSSTKISLAKKTSLTATDMEKNALFDDVLSGYWAYDYIKFAVSNQYMTADNDRFNPSGTMTRGEFYEILNRISKYEAVNNTDSNEILTREGLADMVYEFMNSTGYETDENVSATIKDTSSEAVRAVVSRGIIDISGNEMFLGNKNAERSVIAKAIYMLANI